MSLKKWLTTVQFFLTWLCWSWASFLFIGCCFSLFHCTYEISSHTFSASLMLSSSPSPRGCHVCFAFISNLCTTNLPSLFPVFTGVFTPAAPALRTFHFTSPLCSILTGNTTLQPNFNKYSFSFHLYILISLLWSMQYHTAQPAGPNSHWLSQSNKTSWVIQGLLYSL